MCWRPCHARPGGGGPCKIRRTRARAQTQRAANTSPLVQGIRQPSAQLGQISRITGNFRLWTSARPLRHNLGARQDRKTGEIWSKRPNFGGLTLTDFGSYWSTSAILANVVGVSSRLTNIGWKVVESKFEVVSASRGPVFNARLQRALQAGEPDKKFAHQATTSLHRLHPVRSKARSKQPSPAHVPLRPDRGKFGLPSRGLACPCFGTAIDRRSVRVRAPFG